MKTRKRQTNKRNNAANGTTKGQNSGGHSAAPASRKPIDLAALPRPALYTLAGLLAVLFCWTYYPTFVNLVSAWETQPDYSHGYLVVPFAIYFLWARRESFPGTVEKHSILPAIALFGVAAIVRYWGALYFLQPLDGWSMLFWLAGIAWLLGGWAWLRWSAPSILFLFFMIPLPWRAERWLSYPLQRVATTMSGWTLQCFSLPALTEGNIILLGDQRLEVAQACSGLRIFVGIAALAFAYIVLVRRSWWEKGLLILAVLPIALIANSARIVLTGLLYQFVSDSAAQTFSHDLAGWLMLPFAALLFAMTLWYLGWLFPQVQQLDVQTMVKQRASGHKSPAT